MQIDQSATVLVTGATGFLGRALLETLGKRDCNIRLFARPSTAGIESTAGSKLAADYGARLITGELTSAADMRSACEGVTHIFHLAATSQYSGSRANSPKTIYQSNVEGTRVLAECAAQLTTPPRFVHVSTVAVHGDTGAQAATETSALSAKTAYEATKLEAERLLQDIANRTSLRLTILRPSAIVGPGDLRLLKLFRLANRRLIPIIGSGDNRYQLIHVADMANILVAAAETERAIGQTYVCGNSETLKLRELIELIAQSSSKSGTKSGTKRKKRMGRVISLPAGPVRTVVSLIEKICARMGVEPFLDANRIGFFSTNHWFETNKLIADLGAPESAPEGHGLITHSNASAVADAQRWYEDQGLL